MKIKLTSLFVAAAFICQVAHGQGYQFTPIKENKITSIKNQSNTGTCWSWSGSALLEADAIRRNKGEHDISAMYIVRKNYFDQADKYVRMNGTINFSQGGSFADVFETIDEYGIVPLSVYEGLNYGTDKHAHSELFAGLEGYVSAINKKPNKNLTTAWKNGLNGILDAYFGELPTEFEYQGVKYTPQSFANKLGLKSEDFISITSFSHHPFYKPFPVEVADNWRWANSYNLPLDDFIAVIDNALDNGHSIAWATDVSELGFTRDGIGVIPDDESEENIGSDQARWLGLKQSDKNAALLAKINDGTVKEKVITQEIRQQAFDNQETTDDHGMLIYGVAKDQNGNKFYMIKNSWGETGKYNGIWYVSEAYVRYKTTSAVVHKDALPKNIKNKLNL